MANIGFDAKRAFHNFSGLGNYSRALISAMSIFYEDNDYYLYTPDYKENPLFSFAEKGNIYIRKPHGITAPVPSLWRSKGISSDLKRDRIDIFHGLSGELPPMPSRTRSVVTIHDVIFIRYPEYYKSMDRRIYEYKFRSACKKADIIIAISRQTADDIIKYLGADHRKIEIVYQGCDKEFYGKPSEKQKAEIKAKYSLPDKFILNVGTIEERKNLANIVRAMKNTPEEYCLVAVGRATPYIAKVKQAIAECGMEKRVKMIHDADFRDFPSIYGLAVCATYISRFEGFGIPVLEALNCGTPIITSNISSMPEAGGDAAVYVDPDNIGEINAAINMVLNSPTARESMIKKGYMHAENFREEKVAGNIYDIYNKLL